MSLAHLHTATSSSARSRARARALAFAAHAGPSSRRHLASSAPRSATPVGHYDALSLPRNATKQQIKARFYELSKKHHPDAPGGNTAKFHEINDAYATLGDESKRRQYDTSLQPSRSSHGYGGSGGHGYQPHSPHLRPHASGPHRSWSRGPPPRRPGAGPTMGAGGHYNPFGRRASPDYNTGPTPGYPGAGAGAAYARAGPDPFGRTQRRRGAGAGQGRGGEREEEGGGESGLWRFGIVVGLLLAVVGFGGGLTASADVGEVGEVGVEEEGEGEGRDGEERLGNDVGEAGWASTAPSRSRYGEVWRGLGEAAESGRRD